MNLELKKANRIALEDLIRILKGEQTELAQKLVLTPNETSEFWVTDFDLYKASLVLSDELTHAMLAKALETINIIPAQAASEKKRPISADELEQLKQVNKQ